MFRLVPNLFWVIVEDANKTSALVESVIKKSGLTNRSVILNEKTPKAYKLTAKVVFLPHKITTKITFCLSRIYPGVSQEVKNLKKILFFIIFIDKYVNRCGAAK